MVRRRYSFGVFRTSRVGPGGAETWPYAGNDPVVNVPGRDLQKYDFTGGQTKFIGQCSSAQFTDF